MNDEIGWLMAAAAAVLLLVLGWWRLRRSGWPWGRRPEVDAQRTQPDSEAAASTVLAGPPTVPETAPGPIDLTEPERQHPSEPEPGASAAAEAAETLLRQAQERARLDLAAREAADRQAAAEAAAAAAAQQEAAQRAAAERQAEIERQAAAERHQAERAEAARGEAERQQRLRAEAEAEARRQAAAAAAALAAERLAAEQAAAAAAAALKAPTPPAPRPAAQTLVMVTDDSKVVRVKTSRLLAAHQFRVVLAEDGVQALALIAQEAPQVLITDVEMPGMDGLSLTRALRAVPRTAALPVVMITSADDACATRRRTRASRS
jgi:CheY-like chemotaxis protein